MAVTEPEMFLSHPSDTFGSMNQTTFLSPTTHGLVRSDLEARQALAALDAAGIEYTIVCSGTQPVCPGLEPPVAA